MIARPFLRLPALGLLIASLLLSWSAHGDDTPDALQQAQPCRDAATHLLQSVGAQTDPQAYAAELNRFVSAVGQFVTTHGEGEDTSLHCLNAEGDALLRLGERQRAADVYQRAAGIAAKTFGSSDDSTLSLRGNLAVALTGLNRYVEAEEIQRQIVAAREPLIGGPGAHKLAISLMNLASAQSALGELDAAVASATRAYQIAQTAIDRLDPKYATFLHNYGKILDDAGQKKEGQRYLEDALELRLKGNRGDEAVESLASLAASYFDVGRFEESSERYRQAVALADQVLYPNDPMRAEIARSWCRVLVGTGEAEQGLAQCDDAIARYTAIGPSMSVDVDRVLVNKGIALSALNRLPEAESTLRQAEKALSDAGVGGQDVLEAKRTLGVVLANEGKIEEGLPFLRDVYESEIASLPAGHEEIVLAEAEYGVALAASGRLDEAEARLRDYVRRTEQVRARYEYDAASSMGVFSRFASARMFLAKILITKKDCVGAFDLIESTKARNLSDRLQDRALRDSADQDTQAKIKALDESRARLLIERAQDQGDAAKQTVVDIRMRAIDQQMTSLNNALRAREANFVPEAPSETARHHAFNRSSAILSLGLADNEVLEVTYAPVQGFRCTSLGDWDNLTDTIFAVRAVQSTPGGLTGLMTGNNQIQAQRVVQTGPRSFAALLRARPIPSGAQLIRSSHNLEAAVGSELLGWAAQGLPGIKEITVSTDGLLSLIALDALELDGRPMLNRWELRYVSSFQHIRKPDQPAGVHMPGQALMIVFGDPDYGAPNVAATPSKEAAEKARTIVRGSTGNLVWAPLPAAGAEVDFLRSLFDLVSGQTLFRKKEATAANLRTLDENGRLAKSKYLVFATHAVADIEEPALSSIVLSRRAEDPPRVAYLTAAELATFSIGADLVYFSACETGYGRVVQGEGVLGLSAGVMTAGAKSTVATLWSVEDQASADFTKAFFDKIHHGKSPRVALVEVKKAFQNGRPAGSEFEWAPYVLTEQWE